MEFFGQFFGKRTSLPPEKQGEKSSGKSCRCLHSSVEMARALRKWENENLFLHFFPPQHPPPLTWSHSTRFGCNFQPVDILMFGGKTTKRKKPDSCRTWPEPTRWTTSEYRGCWTLRGSPCYTRENCESWLKVWKVTDLDMSVAARVHFCLMEGEEEVIRETGVSSSKSTDSSCSGSGCGEDE